MIYYQKCSFKILASILCVSSLTLSILFYNKNDIKHLSILQIHDSYDFIIVGGGTTGCVLGTKLSENTNKSILLIEAGDQFNILSSIPLLAVLLQGTKYDWAYKSQPQKFSSFGLHNQIQFLPRGKGLGGSNQINYMVHGIDMKDELENWVSLGINNWGYDKLYRYMSLFQFNASATTASFRTLLLNATKELKENTTYTSSQNSILLGKRWTSYHSHLKSAARRENLHIVLNTLVTKVIFDKNKHAIGVYITDKKTNRIIRSKTEIILSAGVFNTPHILFLSGIGPLHVLNKFHIPMIVDLPGVGRNLHDHLTMPLYVSINKPLSLTINKIIQFSELWKFLWHKEGFLSTTPNAGFIRQNDTGMLLFGMGSTYKNMLINISNLKNETFENMFPLHNNFSQEGFVLLTTCLKPFSRGYVSLQSKNPFRSVLINPKYLSKYKDIDCMIRAVKLAKQILNTTTFKNIGAKIHWPKFSNCKTAYENDYLECIIRTGSLTAYHPGGTCRMGSKTDPFTVVDDTLKVRGVTGLRIMDASILPESVPTYPNSVLIIMAEHAADIIRNELNDSL